MNIDIDRDATLAEQMSGVGPTELDRLRQWKSEAIAVLDEWEAVWVAAGKPGRLGQSKAAAVRQLFRCERCGGSGRMYLHTHPNGNLTGTCEDCDGTGGELAQLADWFDTVAAELRSRCSDSAPGQDVAS